MQAAYIYKKRISISLIRAVRWNHCKAHIGIYGFPGTASIARSFTDTILIRIICKPKRSL